jgi:asparagine synthase (glutamine-hydrolysing)
MCGIAGLIGIDRDRQARAAEKMLAAMAHRGPDANGKIVLTDRSGQRDITLLHTRLAIIDLSPAGNQPMTDRDPVAPNWVVFNGEIYNYQDLQTKLADTAWACQTKSDTETILNGFRVWGEDCVRELQGMFAWCLADTANQEIWMCRDRLGIKPLYLYRPASGGLIFASEIRTILAAGADLVPHTLDRGALETFLAQGAVCGDLNIIEGITSLAPGALLKLDWSGEYSAQRQYFQLGQQSTAAVQPTPDRAHAVNRVATVLRESVARHLLADVPIGVFLSGGIDSTAIATLATEIAQDKIKTISIGFDVPAFDETERAADTARVLGTEHLNISLSGAEIVRDFDEILAAMDSPTVDGFNTFVVARATHKLGIKVALSGLGGDEVFGGYASFRDLPRLLQLRRSLAPFAPMAAGIFAALADILPSRGIPKLAAAWRLPDRVPDLYYLRRQLFTPQERRALHALPPNFHAAHGIPQDLADRLLVDTEGKETFNQISQLELSFYMRYMLLRDADVFSMKSGLELRVPLLDDRLIDTVLPLTAALKLDRSRLKPLLVDAVGTELIQEIARSPKRGFQFPWAVWLRGALAPRIDRVLTDGKLWNALGFEPSAVRSLWHKFQQGDRRISPLQILGLVIFADYCQRHGLELPDLRSRELELTSIST